MSIDIRCKYPWTFHGVYNYRFSALVFKSHQQLQVVFADPLAVKQTCICCGFFEIFCFQYANNTFASVSGRLPRWLGNIYTGSTCRGFTACLFAQDRSFKYPSSQYLHDRIYFFKYVEKVIEGQICSSDVEIQPTVTFEEGEMLVFEVAGHDTQGEDDFSHEHPEGRRTKPLTG
ncbi:hypothetical protein B0J11DRAFT_312147 [Dendryphion nanum]|uniref:Uncharacterized protein n=1 Tax=Dendryphion nanum TaxID=256645 RepID=A0A9P9IKK4_9PLEO|nr:hypothetical protein B0J11DRAFT_312147 [Dendryphion nanum]